MPLGPCISATRMSITAIGSILGMVLIRLHGLSTPPHKRQIPDFQSPLEHRNGEESSIVIIVGFLVWAGQSGILGVIQSGAVSLKQESPVQLTFGRFRPSQARCMFVAGACYSWESATWTTRLGQEEICRVTYKQC